MTLVVLAVEPLALNSTADVSQPRIVLPCGRRVVIRENFH